MRIYIESTILLTWKLSAHCQRRHPTTAAGLAQQNGYTLPPLATPEEFMGDL